MNPVQIDQEQRKEDDFKAKVVAEQHHLARNDSLSNAHTPPVSHEVEEENAEYEEGKRRANEIMDNVTLAEAGRQTGGLLSNLIHKASDIVTGVIATTYRKVVVAAIDSEQDESIAVADMTSVPDHLPLPTPVVKEEVHDGHLTATYTASPLAGIAPSTHVAQPIEVIAPSTDVAQPIEAIYYTPCAPALIAKLNLVPEPAAVMVGSVPSSDPVQDIETSAKEAALATADAAVIAVNKGKEAIETATQIANVAVEKGIEYAQNAAADGVDAAHFASGAAHAVADRAADKVADGKEAASVALEKGFVIY